MSMLKTFNETFYFLIQFRESESKWDVFETHGGDVFEAMAKYLRFVAIEDDHHKRADILDSTVAVSLSPDGPWELLTIAPAWRMCEPVVQDIIERCLLAKHQWATEYLMEMDSQRFSEVQARVE